MSEHGPSTFDVVVVGAGPSGAVAATVLARAGLRVCLVDRARFPRPKLCGDTLNPGALAVLRRLGMASDIDATSLALEGMRVTGDGVTVEARYPDGLHGASLPREQMDHALVRAAVAAGAELRDGVTARAPVLRETPRGRTVAGVSCTDEFGSRSELLAPVTIAADGRRSTLAFALGLARHPVSPRRWAIGACASDVHGLSAYGEMHIRSGYYIGIAPLPNGLANLCVVRPSTGGDAALQRPQQLLADALASEPMLRERMADARFLAPPMVLGPLAVDQVADAAVPDGLLVAGDAAGFIDPMTGDGLRFAVRGGELAALSALRALEQGWTGVHASLDAVRRQEFQSKWRFNRILRGLVGSTAGVRGATLGSRVAPGIVRALIRHASDCHLAAH